MHISLFYGDTRVKCGNFQDLFLIYLSSKEVEITLRISSPLKLIIPII